MDARTLSLAKSHTGRESLTHFQLTHVFPTA